MLLEWPTVREAHTDLADHLAAVVIPERRYRDRVAQRKKVADTIRTHLLELQAETQRL